MNTMMTMSPAEELMKLYQPLIKDNRKRSKHTNKSKDYFLLGIQNIGSKQCIEDFAELNQLMTFKRQAQPAENNDSTMVFMLSYFFPSSIARQGVYARQEVIGYNLMLDLLISDFPDMLSPQRRTRAAALQALKAKPRLI
ncbi:MAG: hypothetical protein ACC707_11635 [Thiohalomonadales bacterium]